MNLSRQALSELREVLKSQMIPKYYEQLTDQDVKEIGEFVMTVMVASLKIKRSLFGGDQ
ncbi:hypothetical protein GCM10011344_20690 [Dokdonia pacifica]|uniref:Uncharacterized protein n=1 Tax=Dokdonia pacifica TaxID=1627892 RepID=A0A238VMY3_9FLAO|nr:hypothetical protein [Dokdonia pacifica]GGG19915.1 hypothetical protein GCM10011344_20690 [Dokdonia pacifica]SNR35596.1 hypothetical protein SAMN06265376_10164 [Dokdonia pacifica]